MIGDIAVSCGGVILGSGEVKVMSSSQLIPGGRLAELRNVFG